MNKEKLEDGDTVCEQCGGVELEVKAWVDFYTDKVLDDTGEDEFTRWCRTCEEHVDFITYKQFKEKNHEKEN